MKSKCTADQLKLQKLQNGLFAINVFIKINKLYQKVN